MRGQAGREEVWSWKAEQTGGKELQRVGVQPGVMESSGNLQEE